MARNTRPRRLVRSMQWSALLSEGEALACIRDYRLGLEYSGEAVNHYGGTLAVIGAGITARHVAAHYEYWHTPLKDN